MIPLDPTNSNIANMYSSLATPSASKSTTSTVHDASGPQQATRTSIPSGNKPVRSFFKRSFDEKESGQLNSSMSINTSINSNTNATTNETKSDEKSEEKEMELSPMLEFPNRKQVLSVKDWKLIFSDLNTIYGLNSQFLESISSVVYTKKWINKPQISDPFSTFTPLFTMYSNYMNKYSLKIDCITSNIENNSNFVEFSQQARKYTQNQLLSALIILPIQRLPRYKLLLAEILKHTEPDYRDYKALSSALVDLENITKLLNERIREYESRIKVNELSQRFAKNAKHNNNVHNNNIANNSKKSKSNTNKKTNDKSNKTWSIVKPHRRFVKEGILNKLDRTGKAAERTFLLFNDCLIYATHSNSHSNNNDKDSEKQSSLKLNQEIPFNTAFALKNIKENKSTKLTEFRDCAFEVHSSVKSFIVFANSIAEKDDWIGAITHTLAEYHNQHLASLLQANINNNSNDIENESKIGSNDKGGMAASGSSEVVTAVPLLIPDDYSDVCMVQGCNNKFTKLKRRHHCRLCGYLICGKCSDKVKNGKNTIKPVCGPCQLSVEIHICLLIYMGFA